MITLTSITRLLSAPQSKTAKVAANLFLVLFIVVGVQFIAKVYAMSYSLVFTTSEIKRTYQAIMADIDGDTDLDVLTFNNDSDDAFKSNPLIAPSRGQAHRDLARSAYGIRIR